MFTLILGLIVCLSTLAIFISIRVKKGELAGVFSKTIASFCFIAFALLLLAQKVNLNTYNMYAIICLALGLVCGLIGDILLDLKVVYPFHKDKYLYAGMTSFLVGHIFYIISMILFSYNEINFFGAHLLPFFLVLIGSAILTVIVWLISTKLIKLNYERFSVFVNIYTFVLIFTTLLSVYLACVVSIIPMYVLTLGFVLFLASDLVLSMQYFGGKLMDKKLIVINHVLYYLAQIIIAMFIYFV